MSSHINELEWKKDQLWRGCILATIAHAIMVSHYPELSNEHSWDGINYSVQDSAGARGTITFDSEYCVAAFRDENSLRINSGSNVNKYFKGAPEEIVILAHGESLQYLLDNVGGKAKPLITTAFWGKGKKLFAVDLFEDILENGGFLLEKQTMAFDEAIEAWKEYYDMSSEQCKLLRIVYERKIAEPIKELTLTKNDIALIGTGDQEGLNESKTSFGEISIVWEE